MYLSSFYKKDLQNLKYKVKRAHIFHLTLAGIISILILSVNNRGMGMGGWLNGQNLLSVIEVIYRQSLTPGFLHYVQNFVRTICISSQLHPNTLKILNDFFYCHLLL